MKHLNHNLLCIVTAFLTGPNHREHDILQICVCPVNKSFAPHPHMLPFIATLKPRRGDYDLKYLGHSKTQIPVLNEIGQDPDFITDRFVEWFDRVIPREGKKLMVLAYDWPLIRSFLIDWMTFPTFDYCFDYRYRDVISASVYLNDRAWWHDELYPFPKHHLTYMTNICKIPYKTTDDICLEAIAIGKLYKRMMNTFTGVEHAYTEEMCDMQEAQSKG